MKSFLPGEDSKACMNYNILEDGCKRSGSGREEIQKNGSERI